MTARDRSGETDRRLTGGTVLWIFVSFFAVVFAANGAFVYFALSSWPGLTTQHAYREGVNYNATLAAARRQAALGWLGEIRFSGAAKAPGVLTARITDRDGEIVSGLDLTARFVRPTREGFDRKVALFERRPGVYTGDVVVPLPGRWHVDVVAEGSPDRPFRVLKTIVVKP